jgi:mono/diheme cytochrome c family protein
MKLSRNMKKLRKAAILVAALGLVSILVVRVENRTVLAATIDQGKPGARRGSEAAKGNALKAGEAVYMTDCAICHGENREGILPGFPPLAGIHHQLTDAQIIALIHDGKGRMPPFPAISNREMATLLKYLATAPAGQVAVPGEPSQAQHKGLKLSPQAAAGGALFQQNCAFCHGRDAMGGETGPDLTRSKLVLTDSTGSNIAHVVSEGRVDGDKRMPAFRFSSSEVAGLVAFIRARVTAAEAMKGGRRGVDVSDLQTGNAQAGKKYFNGGGGCAKCHSPTGDLAGVARRYEGLQLEERMLYPRNAKSTVSVTLADGQTVKGTLAYHDEFTIALRDHGTYRSWPTDDVKYTIDSPVDAHVELFSRYTDDDIHNLMAYIQTLR